MVDLGNTYKNSVRKPEGKRTFRRPGRRWEDNIRMNLWKMWWEDVECIYVDQWRFLLNTVRNLQVS
jgi:hypothetical protein